MTSILNFSSSSSANIIPPLVSNPLFANSKLPTTFIIQPPSSAQTTSNTLLTKRYNSTELGDLLMKKIKTQALSSDSESPINKENSEENGYDCLESTSVIEEINSPSAKSFCEDNEVHNTHRMLEGVLIPQRSISTPLIVNTFNLRHLKGDSADNHKRVQHALEVLQKKIIMDQQASLLKEILFKAHISQEQLVIPPLVSTSGSLSSPVESHGNFKKLAGFDDEKVIYGPVEYPLLAMAPAVFGGDFIQKDLSITVGENAKKTKIGLFGSLAATRAETQRSESDDLSSCSSEESIETLEVRKRQSKKAGSKKSEKIEKGKKADKKEKGQGKEKVRNSKKQK